jgi:hypothetical protein
MLSAKLGVSVRFSTDESTLNRQKTRAFPKPFAHFSQGGASKPEPMQHVRPMPVFPIDAGGNRTSEQRAGLVRSWAENGLNQLTTQSAGNGVWREEENELPISARNHAPLKPIWRDSGETGTMWQCKLVR